MDLDHIMRGLRDNAAANERNEQMLAELATALDTLFNILLAKGELGEGHLKLVEKLRARARPATQPAVELEPTDDKYGVENSAVDCAERMHLCHGRCCSYQLKLSRQDLKEGKLEWNIDKPYYLAKDERGYCVYQVKETGFCGAYDHRPATCRSYVCRDDTQVWLDFENRIPAPMPTGLVTIRRNPTLTDAASATE